MPGPAHHHKLWKYPLFDGFCQPKTESKPWKIGRNCLSGDPVLALPLTDKLKALDLRRSFVPVLSHPSGAAVAGKGFVSLWPGPAGSWHFPSLPSPPSLQLFQKETWNIPKCPRGKSCGGLEPFCSCWMNKSLLIPENWSDGSKLDVLKAGQVLGVHPPSVTGMMGWEIQLGLGQHSWLGKLRK